MNLGKGFICLCEKKIILNFFGSSSKPVDFSHLQISSMAVSMSAFDVLMFLPLQYMLTMVAKHNGFEWSWYLF